MKHPFRSHMIQRFRSRNRTARVATVVVAALLMLLTATTAYANALTAPALTGTAIIASSASRPMENLTFTIVPNANRFHCPADNLCVFNGKNYTGTVQYHSFPGVNAYADLYQKGGSNWRTLSYINNGDYRGWLNQFTTGNHGSSYCMSPNSRQRNITGPWDTDEWLLFSANPNACP